MSATDAQELYGLPLEEFVPTRGVLVKSLRADGERERASEVAALIKPSVGAWAVNQIVRTQSDLIARLFAAGEALQTAQAELLAGHGDATGLRQAAAVEREAVDALVERARGLLTTGGRELSATTLGQVSDTLHAAALDEGARAELRDGCLVRELQHVGVGDAGGLTSAAAPTSSSHRKSAAARKGDGSTRTEREDRKQKAQRQREEKEQHQREEKERAHRRAIARTAEAKARRAAEHAQRDLRAARSRHADAARALREADEALAAAQEEARRTAVGHEQAAQALSDL